MKKSDPNWLIFLNGQRKAAITHSALDIYNIPRIVDKHGVPTTCRRALLVSDASKDFEFLETVSENVGQQVRVFKDPESAIAWLAGCMTSPDIKTDSDEGKQPRQIRNVKL